MSLHAWIDVRLESPKGESHAQAVAGLLASGWQLGAEGQIHVLLPGDNNSFHWEGVPVSSFDWRAYLSEKALLGETAGLTLAYGNTEVGVDLLCREDGSLGFSLCINTVYLANLRCPDFSWYLARLLPALGGEVSSVHCEIA